MKTLRLAILSDTHGLLRPEVLPLLEGVDVILHGGDVGAPEILDRLATVAPVHAIHGNVDYGELRKRLPEQLTVKVEDRRIHLVHDLMDLNIDPVAAGLELVVFGHTHQPAYFTRKGVHFLNPGSIGPRRFRLPICFTLAEWHATGFSHRSVQVGP